MDSATLITAAALFSILLAWYAFLEYREGRGRKGAGPSKTLAVSGGRKDGPGRRRDAGPSVRPYWRSNGKPPARAAAASGRRRILFRGPGSRYGFAAAIVLLAYVFVLLGDLLLMFPPLILFAAAVAATFILAGPRPGLFALALATLLSDFFFVRPTLVFSLDWQVFRLSLLYLLGGLLSVFFSKLLSSRSAAS